MAPSGPRVEALRALLEQHWLHCRHLETERAWFMSIYGAVVGGILAFGATRLDAETDLGDFPLIYGLILFLVVLTFFGFFHTLRWIYSFEYHRGKVNELARALWLASGGEASFDPTMNIPALSMVPGAIGGWKMPGWLGKVNGFFKTRYWFPLFYFIVLTGITLFLFLFIPAPVWLKGLSLAVWAVALWVGTGWYFSLKRLK